MRCVFRSFYHFLPTFTCMCNKQRAKKTLHHPSILNSHIHMLNLILTALSPSRIAYNCGNFSHTSEFVEKRADLRAA